MTRRFSQLADSLLSRLGIDLDFSVDLRRSFMSPIDGGLYLGARPDRKRVSELKQVGITHVVSCLTAELRPKVSFLEDDFEHLFLGVHDGMEEDIAGRFAHLFDFAEAAAAEPSAKLFVHCEVGVSRSATLVTALLMKTEGLSFFDALTRVRSKRIQVLPNIGFASQLQRLEHELRPESVNDVPSSLARYLREICNAPVEIEVLQSTLERHGFDAPTALRVIFGGDIPRVVQGVRS
jgi:atypical dual specificity phosphatase